jgi:hypothetical protein
MDLPLLLAGPILRRVEPTLVSVWVALSRRSTLRLLVWEGRAESGRPDPFLESATPVSTLRVGVALVAGTAWPLLLLPIVLAVTQVAVMREERSLERRFGTAYRSYKASVRRYL